MSKTKKTLDALGYSDSNALHYNDFLLAENTTSNHYLNKIIKELNPTAYYLVDKKPFIMFFECREKNLSPDIIKKIWNAQIPIAIISFENRIEVYNGCSIDENQKLIMLEELDSNQLNDTSLFSLRSLSSVSFWSQYEPRLSAPKLDTIMLNNIRDATKQLKQTKSAPIAVKLILRLIFIRYLIDRGVDLDYGGLSGDISKSQKKMLDIMHSRDCLYSLFSHLKERFNGNLFEQQNKADTSEMDLLDEESLEILRDLMSGGLILSSRQMSLFPLYDFNIIPVELISSIYERFLGNEKQQKDKAFYTPPYLVNYLLEQTVDPFLVENINCKVLDPACGSGIFLVESARRLIERNMSQYKDDFDDQTLINVVTENIWGIDKNPEAIDVAIFSLYLTILDYKNPKTLKNFKLPFLKNKNFFVCDFFSREADDYLSRVDFNFIIGNPPWGSVDGPHIQYCIEKNLPVQNKEISRSFVLRTKDFSNTNTCCCLIVTSKLLYNTKSPSVAFRKWLLEKTIVKQYIELAAVRELIFTKAQGPAGVLIYRLNDDENANANNELSHLTLKPNIFFKLFNIIVIEKNDYKYIPQALLLENDWAWKTIVFGYTQDFYTIKRLREKYFSVNQIIEQNKFSYGRGIEVHDGDRQDSGHLIGRQLIEARRGVTPFNVDLNFCKEFDKERIHRAKIKKQDIFDAPFTLIKKGFDIRSYKFRAAYSEKSVLYPDAVTGICGKPKHKEVLLSLTGLFNSSFYSYLNIMLGSSSGIEREQGFPTEIFKYPVIIDSEIASLVEEVQKLIKLEQEPFYILNDNENSDVLISRLDSLILHKFGLSDDVFVDYAINVQIPLIAGREMSFEEATYDELCKYAKVFIDYFSNILLSSEKYISANIYRNIASHYCAIEFVIQESKPTTLIANHDGTQNSQMQFISGFMLSKVNDLFYQIKDVVEFDKNSFYILKTNENKNWHSAMAKLDLADVLDSILLGNEVPKL